MHVNFVEIVGDGVSGISHLGIYVSISYKLTTKNAFMKVLGIHTVFSVKYTLFYIYQYH